MLLLNISLLNSVATMMPPSSGVEDQCRQVLLLINGIKVLEIEYLNKA